MPHNDRHQNGLFVISELVLIEGGDPLAGSGRDLARRRVNLAGEDLQKRGLARTVGADEAIAVAFREDDIRLSNRRLFPYCNVTPLAAIIFS